MKRALVIAGLVVAVLAALAIRVVIEGRRALAEGDAIASKRPLDAITAWESAARWYLPLAPHVDDAYDRLLALAQADRKYALPAYRAVRRAALATRSLWTPHADDLGVANAAIAELSAAHPDAAPSASQNPAEKAAFYAELLTARTRPSTGAAALAVLGILSWLAGIGVVVRRGIDPSGNLAHRPALVGAVLTVIGLGAWAVGLYNA